MSLESSTKNNIVIPIQDLIERFARLGPNTDFNIIEQILSRKDEALPYIIEIAQNYKYWFPDDGEYASWTPVCALHLLSVIGGPEAINAFINSIKEYYIDTYDWETEDMPAVLANFGIEAFENIKDMLLDNDVDEFVRSWSCKSTIFDFRKVSRSKRKINTNSKRCDIVRE